jgi:DNA uptake protein ComE-like DNA-binding protein
VWRGTLRGNLLFGWEDGSRLPVGIPYRIAMRLHEWGTRSTGWILMYGPPAGESGCILSFMVKVVSATVCVLFLAGCSPNNTESLQRHTADATAAAKRSAGAIARGVAEGLTRKGPLDINAASAAELQRLPGVTPEVAGKIVENRPYASTRDLVRKRVLSNAEFDRVKGQILVK